MSSPFDSTCRSVDETSHHASSLDDKRPSAFWQEFETNFPKLCDDFDERHPQVLRCILIAATLKKMKDLGDKAPPFAEDLRKSFSKKLLRSTSEILNSSKKPEARSLPLFKTILKCSDLICDSDEMASLNRLLEGSGRGEGTIAPVWRYLQSIGITIGKACPVTTAECLQVLIQQDLHGDTVMIVRRISHRGSKIKGVPDPLLSVRGLRLCNTFPAKFQTGSY